MALQPVLGPCRCIDFFPSCALLLQPLALGRFLVRHPAFISCSFITIGFLRDEVVNLKFNPQPGGPDPIFITPGTGWSSYTPRHWIPILVAFYDMHGLQADYSLISSPVSTREENIKTDLKKELSIRGIG
jgi:hypothetical protein